MIIRLCKIFIALGILFSIFSIISLLFLLNESDSKLTYKNTIEGDEYVKEVAKIFSLQDFKSAINSEIKTKNLSGIEIPILIDDYIKNINEWEKKGGIGVHHTDVSKTIGELKRLGFK